MSMPHEQPHTAIPALVGRTFEWFEETYEVEQVQGEFAECHKVYGLGSLRIGMRSLLDLLGVCHWTNYQKSS